MKKSIVLMVCFLLASQVVGQAASQVPQNSYNVRRADGHGCTSVCLTKNGHVVFGNNLDWYIDDGLIVINKRNVKKHGIRSENPRSGFPSTPALQPISVAMDFPAAE